MSASPFISSHPRLDEALTRLLLAEMPPINLGGIRIEHPFVGLVKSLTECNRAFRAQHPGEYVIVTGGTILSEISKDGAVPGMTVKSLFLKGGEQFRGLDRNGNPSFTVVPSAESPYYFGIPLDSSNIQPEHIVRLAEICKALTHDSDCGRIVILIGTDTMAYVAAALARMLAFPTKPIVLVGSMRTPDHPETDAISNFVYARSWADKLDPGVFVCINQQVIDARRVSKLNSESLSAFSSVAAEDVGSTKGWLGQGYYINYPPIEALEKFYAFCENPEAHWERWHQSCVGDPFSMNLHWVPSAADARKLAESIPQPILNEGWFKAGMSADEMRFRSFPCLITRFDNAVYYEQISPGYRLEWLEALFQRVDIRGMIIGGTGNLRPRQVEQFLQIIADHSDTKPTVLFQNPLYQISPRERKIFVAGKDQGAIISSNLTLEYATFELKWLMGCVKDINSIRTAWKHAEAVGGVGYKPAAPNFKTSFEAGFQGLKLQNRIRYVHLIPGYEPDWLRAILTRADVDAVIVGAFGLGNLPSEGPRSLLGVIEDFAKVKSIIVITQCLTGPTVNTIYRTGLEAKKRGVSSAGGLNLSRTISKLDQLLSDSKDPAVIRDKW